ncbi:class I SAM-dependent methyltransferase [Alteromonas sp. KUL49]|uniref:class I SAM-dependent methyltransferase n=1 Tax=Alteromonas sp. KUL49 TaxID=2480798 RepID=UPI00102F02CE|nr:class I SAM-dependent methyltransferase [Alteromonas sp. KUL49]TAP40735.1 methyltransferase [Alteromonas sp. KUL49]GEA10903.1 methyltransferase [Alteromonas sp. KUL49]
MFRRVTKATLSIVLPLALVSTNALAHQHGHGVNEQLKAVVEARSDDEKARDMYRHPAETIAFFKIKPGMTVAEALPGGGWYSKVLAPYLGKEGALHGVNYADDMWARFGFFSAEGIAERQASTAQFPSIVAEITDNGIESSGFTFADVPQAVEGKVDRVLFIRALHNLARFEEDAGTLTQAIEATKAMLKPDGMVGVVQHRAPESFDDANAMGDKGYLKESFIVSLMEDAGFTLVATSDINANPNDKPSETDIVWRLPPTLLGAQDNPELQAKMQAIGESDRMTLLFALK